MPLAWRTAPLPSLMSPTSRSGRPATQCAAVATRSGAISAPPQNGSSANHGYADGFARVPPTIADAGRDGQRRERPGEQYQQQQARRVHACPT